MEGKGPHAVGGCHRRKSARGEVMRVLPLGCVLVCFTPRLLLSLAGTFYNLV